MSTFTGREKLDLEEALKKGAKLSDRQVELLAALRREANVGKRFVTTHKLALRPGEELFQFVNAISAAVMRDRVILGDGSFDVWLHGVYEDHVVVQDMNTGKFLMAKFSRDEKGEISFSPPVEVRMEFVPVAGEPAEKRALPVDVSKRGSGKWGPISTALARR